VRRARKSIAAFKLREGMPVGASVTLRGERGYEFLDRLTSIAIPRIRDFRGLNARSFDGRGNYSMGVREQIIFPEIDYDAIDSVRGLDITITTSAATDLEAYALLAAFGMPFSPDRRPKGYDPEADAAAERAHEQAEVERVAAAATAEADAVKAAEAKAAAAEAKAAKLAAGKPEKSRPKAAKPEVAAELEAEDLVEAEEAVADEAVAEAEIVGEAAAQLEVDVVAEEVAEEIVVEAVAEAEAEAIVTEAVADEVADEPSDAPEAGDTKTTEKESTD
jgi:hypothetical protein